MLSSKNLYNKRVYAQNNNKCLGRIRAFIFYEKNCIGILVKRPDFLLMFHRKPLYIQLDNIHIKKDAVYVDSKSSLVSKKSILPANKSVEEIISWLELPVKIGKEKIGYIKDVYFKEDAGELIKIELSQGLISGAVLGKAEIKSEDIEGYSPKKQAIILKNGAKIFEASGGAAKKAGEATSYVVHTVKKHSPKVIDSMQNQSDKIHGMFNDFKNELKKGMEE